MDTLDKLRTPPTIEYMQNQNIELMRHERNRNLEKTDKYLLPDFPLNVDHLNEIQNYRKELREYFERDDVKNWIFTFENQYPPNLPTKPNFII